MSRKSDFIIDLQGKAAAFIQAANAMIESKEVSDSEGYGSGGADEILDADATAQGLEDAQEVFDALTACTAIKNLMTGVAVGAGVYAAYLDRIRNDIN